MYECQKVDVLMCVCVCVCVCLAVTFLEYWKRKTAEISYIWDCYDFEEAEASRVVFLTIWQGVSFLVLEPKLPAKFQGQPPQRGRQIYGWENFANMAH